MFLFFLILLIDFAVFYSLVQLLHGSEFMSFLMLRIRMRAATFPARGHVTNGACLAQEFAIHSWIDHPFDLSVKLLKNNARQNVISIWHESLST